MERQQYGRDSRYLHTLEELFLMYPFMTYGRFGQLLQLRKDEAEEHYSCVAAKEDEFGKPVFIKYFYSLDAFLSSLGVILKRLWNLSVKREGHL